MQIFKSKQQSDDLQACLKILTIYDIKHTKSYVKNFLDQHVDALTMLAIKDTLQEYGICAGAIRKAGYKYTQLEIPFICAIQKEDWTKAAFTVVTEINDSQIYYLDPLTNSLKATSIHEFEVMDKEIILLLDAEYKKDEQNFTQNRSKERSENIITHIPLFVFITVLLFSFSFMLLNNNTLHWSSPFFLFTSSIGLLISLLLVWHDIDAHNPFIKEVCGGQGGKINCDVVLSSTGAIFLGISWTVWGFTYFTTQFLSIILFTQISSYIHLWAILSLMLTLYIPFSLYYQYRIVKQWCPLCLSILGVISFNAIASIIILSAKGFELNDLIALAHIITIGLITLLLTYYAIPTLKKANESKNFEKRWKKLHYDREIFQTLLSKSDKVHFSPEGLGIVVGNANARNEIIKVCNPYCGPCSKAHPELEQIIKNNSDVKVRIIFTASGEDGDIQTAPVQLLLAIQEKEGKDEIHKALEDWYMAEQKDYETFAKKYPMNGELKQQKEKIHAMRDWCNAMKIRATPTIYINGTELPESYLITELKNFF